MDNSSCVDVTGASLDLSTAMTPEDARTAADTLEKYDPDYDKSNEALDTWVHQVCPPS